MDGDYHTMRLNQELVRHESSNDSERAQKKAAGLSGGGGGFATDTSGVGRSGAGSSSAPETQTEKPLGKLDASESTAATTTLDAKQVFGIFGIGFSVYTL